jgi:hypothetical protein
MLRWVGPTSPCSELWIQSEADAGLSQLTQPLRREIFGGCITQHVPHPPTTPKFLSGASERIWERVWCKLGPSKISLWRQ